MPKSLFWATAQEAEKVQNGRWWVWVWGEFKVYEGHPDGHYLQVTGFSVNHYILFPTSPGDHSPTSLSN